MTDLWFNIRFGEWHLQIRGHWPCIELRHNTYQAELRASNPAWRWFEIMETPWGR